MRKYDCCSVIAKASTAVTKHVMIVKLISVFASGGKPAEIRHLIHDMAAILTLDFFLVRRTEEKFIETSDRNGKEDLKKKTEKVKVLCKTQ